MARTELSIVLPVFNEERTIPVLYDRVSEIARSLNLTYELIFVDDGSHDNGLSLLKQIGEQDSSVRIVSLSRNFGHQIAITAGLDYSRGDAVIVMDSDLQDPPGVIPQLVAKWREGFEVVHAVRSKREGERAFKRVTAALFYRILDRISTVKLMADAGDFRLMSRRAVNQMKSMRERNRYVRGLSSWIGFKQATVLFVREGRHTGPSKYNLAKMVKFALDAVTGFGTAPLQFALLAGGVMVLLGLVGGVAAVIGFSAVGGTTPVAAALLSGIVVLGGVQLAAIGLLGEYVVRIYDEVKNRPLYLVSEAVGVAERPGDEETASSGSQV